MKHLAFLILSIFISCQSFTQHKSMDAKKNYNKTTTKNEWQQKLTQMQFFVLREAGTERPGTSEYDQFFEKGTYVCAGCETPLYESDNKYDAGCGWPSFDKAIEEHIELDVDYKVGYARTELKCNNCGGHLGHRFNDGPAKTTGQRHCINGVALKFVPEKND